MVIAEPRYQPAVALEPPGREAVYMGVPTMGRSRALREEGRSAREPRALGEHRVLSALA
jgi:hypothetical protein